MYSPRRYKYSNRYYHNRFQSKFSPAARKQERPTYNQQKGRILQTSPRFMYNPLTRLPNSKTYDKMYETLKKVKYPALIPQPMPYDVLPFPITYSWFFNVLFTAENNFIFDNNVLQLKMDAYMNSILPQLVQYHPNWTYQIFNFYITLGSFNNELSNVQYHIDWKSNLIGANSYQMVLKTVNNPMQSDYTSPRITVQPRTQNELRAFRISQTTSGTYTQTYNDLVTNDPNTSDNGLYPIMDTSANTDSLYHSQLEWVSESSTAGSHVQLAASIICFPA